MNRLRSAPRIAAIDIREPETLQTVYRLQQRSYGEEAKLIGFERLPPLLETPQDLMESRECFVGTYDADRLVGVMGYVRSGSTIEIHRLFVEPTEWRRHFATRLLSHIHSARGVTTWRVATADLNLPAKALYQCNGYSEVNRFMRDGLTIVEFARGLS